MREVGIDITQEDLILFSVLPNYLPPQPSGKRVHLSACYRWKNTGICGVRLETIFIAGNRSTSKQAVNRFWHRVTAAKDQLKATKAKPSESNQCTAVNELDAAGW